MTRTRLGEAGEDALKAVHDLQGAGRPVSTSSLAGRLRVSEPTVTALAKRLAKLGLLRYTPYRGVELTGVGEKLALEVIRHHRLLELYLVRALGMPWDKVHVEADRLEHVISDEVEDRMDLVLGHPSEDPHGDPIPSKDGRLAGPDYDRLADLTQGDAAIVRRVPDRDPELLQYLGRLGLVPGARVRLLEVEPFGGPLTLEIEESQRVVAQELAATIQVSRSGEGRP